MVIYQGQKRGKHFHLRLVVFDSCTDCKHKLESHQNSIPCCSVTQSCPTLGDPMDCGTPGSSVLCCLLELAQIHVHWVGDDIQPSHPLPPSSPLAFTLPSIVVFFSGFPADCTDRGHVITESLSGCRRRSGRLNCPVGSSNARALPPWISCLGCLGVSGGKRPFPSPLVRISPWVKLTSHFPITGLFFPSGLILFVSRAWHPLIFPLHPPLTATVILGKYSHAFPQSCKMLWRLR